MISGATGAIWKYCRWSGNRSNRVSRQREDATPSPPTGSIMAISVGQEWWKNSENRFANICKIIYKILELVRGRSDNVGWGTSHACYIVINYLYVITVTRQYYQTSIDYFKILNIPKSKTIPSIKPRLRSTTECRYKYIGSILTILCWMIKFVMWMGKV